MSFGSKIKERNNYIEKKVGLILIEHINHNGILNFNIRDFELHLSEKAYYLPSIQTNFGVITVINDSTVGLGVFILKNNIMSWIYKYNEPNPEEKEYNYCNLKLNTSPSIPWKEQIEMAREYLNKPYTVNIAPKINHLELFNSAFSREMKKCVNTFNNKIVNNPIDKIFNSHIDKVENDACHSIENFIKLMSLTPSEITKYCRREYYCGSKPPYREEYFYMDIAVVKVVKVGNVNMSTLYKVDELYKKDWLMDNLIKLRDKERKYRLPGGGHKSCGI